MPLLLRLVKKKVSASEGFTTTRQQYSQSRHDCTCVYSCATPHFVSSRVQFSGFRPSSDQLFESQLRHNMFIWMAGFHWGSMLIQCCQHTLKRPQELGQKQKGCFALQLVTTIIQLNRCGRTHKRKLNDWSFPTQL